MSEPTEDGAQVIAHGFPYPPGFRIYTRDGEAWRYRVGEFIRRYPWATFSHLNPSIYQGD